LGIPLAANIAGSLGVAAISILMPFVIIMFNVYTIIELNIFAPRETRKSIGQLVLSILKSVITNPLIIAVLLGLPFLFSGWRIPSELGFIEKTVSYLSDTTQALILVALGAGFSFSALKGKWRYSLPCAIYKVAVLPIIAVVIAHCAFGFSNVELAIIFVLFGSPSAVSSYIMAKTLKSDAEVAGQVLLLSTLFCILTLFIGIFALKTLGWIVV
jgi:predicted permease